MNSKYSERSNLGGLVVFIILCITWFLLDISGLLSGLLRGI